MLSSKNTLLTFGEKMDFERVNYFASLLDFYGGLLTEKQFEIAKMFFYDNLNFSEIADISSTTKQAINDLIKRTQAILEDYENKLKVYHNYSRTLSLLSKNPEIKEKFIKIWEK